VVVVGTRCRPRSTTPDQHLAILVGGYALCIDELGFEILQVVVVKGEPAFERPIGHALSAR